MRSNATHSQTAPPKRNQIAGGESEVNRLAGHLEHDMLLSGYQHRSFANAMSFLNSGKQTRTVKCEVNSQCL